MDNCFFVEFLEQRIFVPKKLIEFKHGLGIVEVMFSAISTEGEDLLIPVIGVVDENFKVVMDYKFKAMVQKIDILPGGNIIAVVDTNEDFSHPNFNVVLLKNNGERAYPGSSSYEIVDDDLVILKEYVGKRPLYCLSSLSAGIVSYNMYNYISHFEYKPEFQEEVAEVGVFVPVGDDPDVFDVLTFYIDKNDAVVSSYKYRDEVFDATLTLNEVLQIICKGRC